MEEGNLLQWGGVGFGEEETFRLFLSLKQLASTIPDGHESLRFWGRINTRCGFYYVVEGKTFEDPDGLDMSAQEGLGGVNRFTYWVSKSSFKEDQNLFIFSYSTNTIG